MKARRTSKAVTKPRRKRTRPARRAARPGARAAAGPFAHVVLLIMENRSFDHMLGGLRGVIAGLDGVDPTAPHSNRDDDGRVYQQRPTTTRKVDPDLPHEMKDVVYTQLFDDNGGFVRSYSRTHPDTEPSQRQEVMWYHPLDDLPVLHALAREFVVCDRWYCSVPGPTWTNRLFAMSGTSLGRVNMPAGIFEPNLHDYDQPSVFRRIDEAGRSYHIYSGDFPLSLLLADQRTSGGSHYYGMRWFAPHTRKPAAQFPDFAFIEPDYLWPSTNDDHPPHDLQDGQALMAEVYTAIRANEDLWTSTLLIITYDEHGGFYDHVVPPAAPPPDDHREEYTFDRFGVRVPAVLVSPWLAPGVRHEEFDHTSLLHSLRARWNLGDLGARVKAANDLLDSLEVLPEPRNDAPMSVGAPSLRAARAVRRAATAPRLTDNQRAIIAFSEFLETETRGTAPGAARAAKQIMKGPGQASQIARARARRFLAQRGGTP